MKKTTGNFGLKIKTNQYAGNFERELTAYCTGRFGNEDNTGYDFVENLPLSFDNIELIPDDHNYYRPVDLDEEDSNNLIIWFESKPTEDQIKLIQERASKFSEFRSNHPTWGEFYKDPKDNIEILGIEVIKY